MKKIFLMRIFRLSFFISFLILGFFVILPSKISSATNPVINEFLPHPNSGNKEWVEFYNPDQLDLSFYFLDDDADFNSDTGSSSRKSLSSINIDNQFYPYIEFSSFLNNSGDFVVLFSSNGEILDKYEYTEDQGQDISIGRSPDGNGAFTILSSATKGSLNSPQAPTSTPIPTIVPTSTKTPTATRIPTSTSKVTTTSKVNSTPTRIPVTAAKTEISQSRQIALIDEDVEVSTTSPTSILGVSSQSATPTSAKEKGKDIKILGDTSSKIPIIFAIAGIFLGACAILAFFIYRKKLNHESV